MIASLPMYDRPANRAAHDRLWGLIRDALRDRGRAAPDRLTRDLAYHATWARPDLVLGHVCIRPWRAVFHAQLTDLGASDYGLDGCPPGYYRSVYVMRAADDRAPGPDLRLAANSPDSQSGFAALAELGRATRPVSYTGSHDASLMAVAEGRADLAAIDQQTWTMQQRDMAQVGRVRVAGHSSVQPGQTFVTARANDPAPYRAAVADGIAAMSRDDRALLGLRGLVTLSADAYRIPAAVA